MKTKEDKQFLELLQMNSSLLRLGGSMQEAIEKYGKYSKYGMSPNMKEAVKNWKEYLEENFTRIP